MTTVIGFANQKGGVGKTTLSVACAKVISSRGFNVCLVDIDPQANSSAGWTVTQKIDVDLADLLYEQAERREGDNTTGFARLADALIQVDDNFDVLPSRKGTDGGRLSKFAESPELQHYPYIFTELVKSLSELGYEFVIFDLSPSKRLLERVSLLAVNEVLCPITPQYFAQDGLGEFTETLREIKRGFQKTVVFNKVILNKVDRRNGDDRLAEQKWAQNNSGLQVFIVPQDSNLNKLQAAGTTKLLGNDRNFSMKPKTQEAIMTMVDAIIPAGMVAGTAQGGGQ